MVVGGGPSPSRRRLQMADSETAALEAVMEDGMLLQRPLAVVTGTPVPVTRGVLSPQLLLTLEAGRWFVVVLRLTAVDFLG